MTSVSKSLDGFIDLDDKVTISKKYIFFECFIYSSLLFKLRKGPGFHYFKRWNWLPTVCIDRYALSNL